MLHHLSLRNVGPAPEMEVPFGPRLNLLTGDNGLGKSFLLDVAWWALTGVWPRELNGRLMSGYPARPRDRTKSASIQFAHATLDRGPESSDVSPGHFESAFFARMDGWDRPPIMTRANAIVVFADSEQGASVWDPARNLPVALSRKFRPLVPGYSFTQLEVWDGLHASDADGKRVLCNGLLADWASWLRERGEDAARMDAVLQKLAPEGEAIRPGKLTRLALDDARDIPTIDTDYATGIPILHASAGLRRILGLAYLLVWAWREHRFAAELRGEETAKQIVLLVDEVEAHFHPRWQRTILPSLLKAAEVLDPEVRVQLIVVTHSPIVMAAAEPLFDAATDKWLDLDLTNGRVTLTERDFVKQGTAGKWLTTEAFHLPSEGRSLDAEAVIAEASLLVDRDAEGDAIAESEVARIDTALSQALPEFDEFRTRWDFWQRNRTRPADDSRLAEA